MSGSESLALVKSPATGVSSSVEMNSLLITGESFTAFTVIIKVSLAQVGGNGLPLSQMLSTMMSRPLKLSDGV